MALCNITSGATLGCRDNVGGIESVFILSGSITTITAASNEITDISGTGTFFEFELPRNVGDFTETPNPSLENGTLYFEQVVNIVIQKLQTSVRNQVNLLALNPNLKMIVKTNNGTDDGVGQYFLVGRYRGMSVSAGTGATGTAFGDANQYALAFTGQEPQPFFEVSTGGTGVLTDALTGITVA
tara:strand:+ start:1252 stop:1803 length:552 start_codon:yes stop_codon:yes gene_type:complete